MAHMRVTMRFINAF